MPDTVAVLRQRSWLELTISRPQVRNALDRATLAHLRELVQDASTSPGSRAVIITGEGDRAFSAGADIPEMFDLREDEVARFAELGQEVTFAIEACPLPVIAAVNGVAFGGGCEIALACDLIFAADTAQLGLPEVTLAIIPGWGGTQRLVPRVGIGRAREMILTGRRVGAEEALRIGLVDRVVPADRVMEEARFFAAQLATLSAPALAAAKEALRSAVPLSPDGFRREAELFCKTFETEERPQAMGRFLKR
jgi:enoyl-CoA hydratase